MEEFTISEVARRSGVRATTIRYYESIKVLPTPRVAAVLQWIIAVGFGVFCVPAMRNLLLGRAIPIVMGFPAYGRGSWPRPG
jgi:transcriptional regulator with XRE-family HTH domain